MRFIYLFLVICNISFGQNIKSSVVLNKENNEPLEFVSVYNALDHTATNKEGRFSFSSSLDSIYFYKVGYQKLNTTFNTTQDTIFLEKNIFKLDEVIVSNEKSLLEKIKDSIKTNYVLTPYNEKFFLRALLKTNGDISRLQDIQGKLKRKTSLYTRKIDITKKDYAVEITNMRKIGIATDEEYSYFVFPSFYDLLLSFVRLNATGDNFVLTKKYFDNGKKIKWEFSSVFNEDEINISGYYIVNLEDMAFEYFNLKSNPLNPKFTINKKFKYRTTYYEIETVFKKDKENDKYFIELAKFNTNVESSLKDESKLNIYNATFLLSSSNNFEDLEVKSNIKEDRDIFKLNYKYDEDFWNEQNQLLLTNEMLEFIEKMKVIDKQNNKIRIKTNIK
ncbi:carboxypeptidase-like regulatory domain-containing protein [Cellulophaga baltica]|uniref:carboxypeptidase-like regulatory domain-containing protein n=1 Tax=Cellulophaga TaxID=104264 RepID=UPI001C06C29C|nr:MULTISPECIES: carboxypeptidase-like regulatory domain-containing protein [Cellulophaga]MBU2995003.1 carboxypeptidase-like regulatory domain-containing protein [Cellulophaga baltica]MDO6766398.1 carboxypeptidase-like regulatory domain-containing protein [Cellulophaga sp. 1_MG-2023]